MKVDSGITQFESNITNSNAFTIKTTAKAFDILSSGLYKNPIHAIIRELSTNAIDSHVVAGTTNIPFEVHLPTPLEPYFMIRDFGTGLSDEQIRGEVIKVTDDNGKEIEVRNGGLYTTYFDSDKTDSNDVIGTLGLGSKSPFSYTRTFNVTSFYNGTQYMYAVFINEHGVPSVSLLTKVDTDQLNGLKIHIPVKATDIDRWQETCRDVFSVFNQSVKYKITSHADFQILHISKGPQVIKYLKNIIVEQAGYYDYDSNNTNVYVIMGNIKYPVDIVSVFDLVDDRKSLTSKTHPHANILNFFLQQENYSTYRWTIEIPIGAVDITASRDGLHYSKKTKRALIDIFKNTISVFSYSLISEFEHIAQNTSSYFEFYTKTHDDLKRFTNPVKWIATPDKILKHHYVRRRLLIHNGTWKSTPSHPLSLINYFTFNHIDVVLYKSQGSPSSKWTRSFSLVNSIPDNHTHDPCISVTNSLLPDNLVILYIDWSSGGISQISKAINAIQQQTKTKVNKHAIIIIKKIPTSQLKRNNLTPCDNKVQYEIELFRQVVDIQNFYTLSDLIGSKYKTSSTRSTTRYIYKIADTFDIRLENVGNHTDYSDVKLYVEFQRVDSLSDETHNRRYPRISTHFHSIQTAVIYYNLIHNTNYSVNDLTFIRPKQLNKLPSTATNLFVDVFHSLVNDKDIEYTIKQLKPVYMSHRTDPLYIWRMFDDPERFITPEARQAVERIIDRLPSIKHIQAVDVIYEPLYNIFNKQISPHKIAMSFDLMFNHNVLSSSVINKKPTWDCSSSAYMLPTSQRTKVEDVTNELLQSYPLLNGAFTPPPPNDPNISTFYNHLIAYLISWNTINQKSKP